MLRKAGDDLTMAVLCQRGIEFPRTHNISVLLDLLAEHTVTAPILRDEPIMLSPFGVLFRHDEVGPTEAELKNLPGRKALLALSEATVTWAKTSISK